MAMGHVTLTQFASIARKHGASFIMCCGTSNTWAVLPLLTYSPEGVRMQRAVMAEVQSVHGVAGFEDNGPCGRGVYFFLESLT